MEPSSSVRLDHIGRLSSSPKTARPAGAAAGCLCCSTRLVRIAIVNKFAHLTGGADRHCLDLAAELRRAGHDVAFLSTASEANVDGEGVFVPPTVTHTTRDDLPMQSRLSAAARAFWNPAAAAGMQRLLEQFDPDVVHAHKLYPQLSVAPVVVARRAGYPVVQTLHDFELLSASPLDARGGWWDHDDNRLQYRFLNSALLPVRRDVHQRAVDRFIAVSRFTARVFGARGIETVVVPNFITQRLLSSAPPSFEDRSGILFLGRLRPEKGVLDLVELARLSPEVPVTVVGSGVLAGEVEAAAKRLPNLRVAGFLADDGVRRALARARVVVVPSRCHEPGPFVPLEAMACGTPVVAYANGGLAEYVVDAGAGRIVPPDPVALAAAAGELHESAAEWRAASARGRRGVEEHHSAEAHLHQLLPIYERAVSARASRRRRRNGHADA